MRQSFKKIIASALACTLAFATAAVVVPQDASAYDVMKGAKRKVDKKVNLDTPEYHAYLNFQCVPAYSFRNAWFASYGDLDKTNRAEDGSSYGANVLGWAKDEVNKLAVLPGTFTDCVIDGNGTYTLKVEGLEGCLNDGNTTEPNESFQMLYVSTDLPGDAKDKIQITNIVTKIDGVEKAREDEAFIDPEPIEYVNCLVFDIINQYNNELGDHNASMMLPQDSIEITFDVSGFNKDSEQTATSEEVTSSSSASSGTDTSAGTTTTTTTTTESETSNSNTPIIIFGVIAGVVVVVVVIVIIVSRKKE